MLINVRAETSKVRKSRRLYSRDEGYVRTWANIIANVWKQPSIRDRLVFSLDGYKPFSKRALHYHFDKLMKLAEIDRANRDLVPYSFRHYFITERITAGLSYQQVAEMCGTSIAQIERTYYHLNDQVRMTHALTGYEIDDDGLVVPLVA